MSMHIFFAKVSKRNEYYNEQEGYYSDGSLLGYIHYYLVGYDKVVML